MQVSAAGMTQMADILMQKVQTESDMQLKMAKIAMQEQLMMQQQQTALAALNAALTGVGQNIDTIV